MDTLLKCSHSASINDLAPIWKALSKVPRKEDRSILQAALNDHSRTPGSSTSAPLLFSKEILSTIKNLIFWSGDPDRLNEGIYLFFTLYTIAAKKFWNQLNLLTYELLSRNGYLILKDI